MSWNRLLFIQIHALPPSMHDHKWKEISHIILQNNQWKLKGDQLPQKKSSIDIKDNSNCAIGSLKVCSICVSPQHKNLELCHLQFLRGGLWGWTCEQARIVPDTHAGLAEFFLTTEGQEMEFEVARCRPRYFDFWLQPSEWSPFITLWIIRPILFLFQKRLSYLV